MTTLVQVYQILTRDTHGNAYAINRDETWTVVKDREFETRPLAEEYILSKVKENPDFLRLTVDISDIEDKEQALHNFMTDPKYLFYHRFFIEYPPISAIKKSLQDFGVKIGM